MDRVCILGTGPSLRHFNGADCSLWAVGSSFKNVKADLYFCMHDFDKLPDGVNAIYQDGFPLDEIIKAFGSSFFTNTISYMIAYALYKGVKAIYLYGVDMDSMSEYEHQKASVDYWIGFARGRGVIVTVNSDIDKTDFLYGYEPTGKIIKAMQKRLYDAEFHFEHAESENEKNQWIGCIYDLKYWIRRLKQ